MENAGRERAGRMSRARRVRIAVYGAAWLLLACLIAVFLAEREWVKYYRLSRHGVTAQATVTGKEPDNHLSVHYTFSVDSQNYSGIGGAGSQDYFDRLKVGDKVQIRYLVGDPRISSCYDPRDELVNATMGIVLFSAVG